MPEKTTKKKPPVTPVGSHGLQRWGNTINEEWLRELSGTRGMKVYREMTDNDPTVGSVLFAIEQFIRGAKWYVRPAKDTEESIQAAKFVETCMHDMDTPWSEFVAEVLSMLPYGYSLFEVIYKYRRGDSNKESEQSRHKDGKIGWKDFSIRAQETKEGWEFNDWGRATAFIQRAPPLYRPVTIPLDRCLLFRTKHRKGSPEGVSILRNAYLPYYFRKNIQMIEGIGIERDLAGLPVLYAPQEVFDEGNETKLQELRDLVQSLRRDEEEGIVLPWDPELKTNEGQLYKLELLASSGRRQFDLNEVLLRYDQSIARSVLADFVFLGINSRGSYALMREKRTVFETALLAWIDSIVEVLNRKAVPKLFQYNAWNIDVLPQIDCEIPRVPSLREVSEILKTLLGAGIELFDEEEMQTWMRSQFGMPPRREKDQDGEQETEEDRSGEAGSDADTVASI